MCVKNFEFGTCGSGATCGGGVVLLLWRGRVPRAPPTVRGDAPPRREPGHSAVRSRDAC